MVRVVNLDRMYVVVSNMGQVSSARSQKKSKHSLKMSSIELNSVIHLLATIDVAIAKCYISLASFQCLCHHPAFGRLKYTK